MCMYIYICICAQVPTEKEKRIGSIKKYTACWALGVEFQVRGSNSGWIPNLSQKNAVNLILTLPSHALSREIAILHYVFSCRQDPEFFVYKTLNRKH